MSRRRISLLVSGLVIAVAVVSAAAWSIAVQTTSAQDRGGGAVETGQRGLAEGSQDGVEIDSGCLPGPGVLAEYIARDLLQVEQFLLAFVPGDLVVVALGEGGTVSAHPAKIALQVLYEANAVAVLALEQANALANECEVNFDRDQLRNTLVPRIDVVLSTRASQASLDAHDVKISGKLDLSQWTLDNMVELRKVDVEVTRLRGLGRFLVSASDGGQPLANVQFISVQVALEASPSFIDVTANTTVTMVAQGVYLVQIALPANVTYATLFAFEVKHNNGVVDHFGFTVFSENATSWR